MKIKKVVAADMQEAMQRIRRELGEDAVIISSVKEPIRRNLKHFFRPRRIEVTAALDDLPEKIQENIMLEEGQEPPTSEDETQIDKQASVTEDINCQMPPRIIPGKIVPAKLPEPILNISNEKENEWFKIVLQQEIIKEDAGVEGGMVDKWKKVLRQIEVDDTVITSLLKDFTQNFNQDDLTSEDIFKVHLKHKIIELLQPVYKKEKGKDTKIYSFIGPTGVGKSLTLAKLATRLKVVEKKQIGLIAVYNHRFGAVEKLNFYGNIIGVPVDVVMTPGELSQAVESHSDKDAIFIDNEGRPSMNRSQVLELHTFTGAVLQPQNIYLVMGTPTKNRDLMRIANDFMPIGYNNIIMTKLDETDTYGALLNLICNTGLPVAYMTNGQNVPDDIERITPKRFADILLGGVVIDEDHQMEYNLT